MLSCYRVVLFLIRISCYRVIMLSCCLGDMSVSFFCGYGCYRVAVFSCCYRVSVLSCCCRVFVLLLNVSILKLSCYRVIVLSSSPAIVLCVPFGFSGDRVIVLFFMIMSRYLVMVLSWCY